LRWEEERGRARRRGEEKGVKKEERDRKLTGTWRHMRQNTAAVEEEVNEEEEEEEEAELEGQIEEMEEEEEGGRE